MNVYRYSIVTLNYCEKEWILHYQITVIKSRWCFQIHTIWSIFCKNLQTFSYFLRKTKVILIWKGTGRRTVIHKSYTNSQKWQNVSHQVHLTCMLPHTEATHISVPEGKFQRESYVITSCFQFSSQYNLSDKRDVSPQWGRKSFSASWFRSYATSPFGEFLQRNRIFFWMSCWSTKNPPLKEIMNLALCKQGSLNSSRFCAQHWHSSQAESGSQHCIPRLVKRMVSFLSALENLHLPDHLVLLPFF